MAMAVLVVVIFAATNLVVSIIRTNRENVNTLTAYGLAQESLEAVRNMRDSNWLLGARYDGTLGSLQQEIWGAAFPAAAGQEEYYVIRYGVFDRPYDDPSIFQIPDFTPWKLESISGPEDEETQIVRDASETVHYEHADFFTTDAESTPFRRYVVIQNVSDSSELAKIRVASVVSWEEYGRPKEVRLVTDLTDWNQGQL